MPEAITEEDAMNPALLIRGCTVHDNPLPGTLPVAGPYRPGAEDWMLFQVVNDFRRVGAEPIFVAEKAREELGGWWGVTVYRRGVVVVHGPAPEAAPGAEEEGVPMGVPEPHVTNSPQRRPKMRAKP